MAVFFIKTGLFSGRDKVILNAPSKHHQPAVRDQIIERSIAAVMTAIVNKKKIRMMFFMALLRKRFNYKTALRRRGGF